MQPLNRFQMAWRAAQDIQEGMQIVNKKRQLEFAGRVVCFPVAANVDSNGVKIL